MEGLNTTFNHYELPLKWDKKVDVGDMTRLRIFVNEKDSFQTNNINIFTNYVLTFFSDQSIQKWLSSCNMSYYQNQLNFAVWCVSSGCGVSVNDHINTKENLLSSVYRFHIYYQTRKILEEMSCPIPGESIFNATDNRIDMLKYQKLCNEFEVKPLTDFRFKGGDNGGLGTMYNYATHIGYRPFRGVIYNSKEFQFIPNSTNEAYKIDYVKQDAAIDGWKQFLLEKSNGFTKAGLVRLDDSIRTYVYCTLGAQAQTRSNILHSAETQQYFVNLLEQNIKSLFSIPESITQYQNAINNTNARVDYVISGGLYMIPTELTLNIGSVQGYNNHILIADQSAKPGHNANVNREQIIIKPDLTAKPGHNANVNREQIIIKSDQSNSTSNLVLQKEKLTVEINNTYLYFGIVILVFCACYVILKK